MKAHLSNAAYGIADYAAYPVGMLIVAPIILRNLGIEQYGVWAVATAAINAGSIVASGFGDANIQQVATERIRGDFRTLQSAVRSTMGIHLLLGSVIAIIFWIAAPYLASHIGQFNPALQSTCLWCLRIAGLMTFARAIESVCISTQRAYERYGAAVRVSVLARLLSLATAAALTAFGQKVVSIFVATAFLTMAGLCLQLVHLKQLLHADTLLPYFDPQTTNALFKFGIFSWLLATSGVLFSQADKLIGGVSFGAAAIASYALCAQMAQPIYGLAASGLHFLFPYLSGKRVTASSTTLKRAVLLVLTANVAFVLLSTLGLLLFGNRILLLWGGDAIARSGAPLLPIVVWSSALLSLNVTGSYAMLALGRVQAVTFINLAAGGTMLLLIAWLLPRYGMIGFAEARLIYGMITLLIYIPLALHLRPGSPARLGVSTGVPAGEEA
jgi:O-antigen/teichoic acid export membrane protein